MDNCGQACPYNTLDGCKVKEYNAICPLTNMATPVTEYRMTNADRIRAMSDEELAEMLWKTGRNYRAVCADPAVDYTVQHEHIIDWLRKPAEGEMITDVNEKKLAEEAREARNAYARKWRAANPDKVGANNANYWLRRAAKEAARKEAEER